MTGLPGGDELAHAMRGDPERQRGHWRRAAGSVAERQLTEAVSKWQTTRKAMVDGRLMTVSPEAPAAATCPACSGQVEKRKRQKGDGEVTWFWWHRPGDGDGCPKRYDPNGY